ncbi:MAG: SIS domain-containing protein, partial [Protaetiibacter sp.]
PWRPYDAVIGITRSGTTTEVLQALRALPEGVRKVVVTGVADSPAAELADEVLVLDFADENSVVQTRFPTTFLYLARAAFGEDVSALPELAEQAIAVGPPEAPEGFDHVVYLGRGWTYGLAQEAALKIREAAQAWAESYPLLDYRHGPLAVAHPGSLVWLLGVRDDELARDIEVTGATVVQSDADPLVQLALAQQLAVRTAVGRGLDPDHPRHLTRSIVLG